MNAATLSPIASRFAWKEYRTLRGFWLAALVIAAVLQALSIALAPPSSDPVTTTFGIALAAAALYAVGVAATTFSMEHEEETYAYLTGLPTRWFPLFTGKASFALTSSLMLVAVLLLTAWLLAGMRAPSAERFQLLLATFGFAIIEMLSWGMFFSLLIRQPLLAALLAIGAQSLAVTWAVNIFAQGALATMALSSYAAVLPVRVAITTCVLGIDVLLARRWLVHESSHPTATPIITHSSSTAAPSLRRTAPQFFARVVAYIRRCNLRVLSHLLWQAWRQSWKPMLTMCAIVLFVCFSIVLIAGLGRLADNLRYKQVSLLPFGFALLASALYWSLAFHADQRGQKYRFLADRAVWPHYVWLSRLLVWSLPVVLALAVAAALSLSGAYDLIGAWRRRFEQMLNNQYWWEGRHISQEWREVDYVTRGLIFSLWGGLLGFAVGQATSMFFRRALVAGFAALVITLPLMVWGVAVWSWELSPFVFVLPLVMGAVVATWLRVPDWLIDRNTFGSWLKVLAAIAIPIAFIVGRLPSARALPERVQRDTLIQIQGAIGAKFIDPLDDHMPFDPASIVAQWVERANGGLTDKQREIGDQLVRVAEQVEIPQLPTAPPGEDPTEAELQAYYRRKVDLNHAILPEAVRLSREDFRFVISDASFDRMDYLIHLLNQAGHVATRNGDLDAALDYYLAALRLWERLWSSRSTNTFASNNSRQLTQWHLFQWAQAEGQTSARIKQAIKELDAIYLPITETQPGVQSVHSFAAWTPPPQIVSTYESLRDIILSQEPSHLLDKNADLEDYAAVISNEVPFERRRALQILELLTINEVARWRDVVWRTNQQLLREWAEDTIRERGEGGIDDMGEALRRRVQQAYSYSFSDYNDYVVNDDYPPYSWLRTTPLLRAELKHFRPFGEWLTSVVDTQVAAWGLRQQLALIAYRLDHGEYPQELAELAPDYLPFVPIDPYSGRPFEYRAEGLPLELRSWDSPRLDPRTPFLWSVGPHNGQLEVGVTVDAVDPNPDPAADPVEVRHEIYTISSHSYWQLSSPLVFPLPKDLPQKLPK